MENSAESVPLDSLTSARCSRALTGKTLPIAESCLSANLLPRPTTRGLVRRRPLSTCSMTCQSSNLMPMASTNGLPMLAPSRTQLSALRGTTAASSTLRPSQTSSMSNRTCVTCICIIMPYTCKLVPHQETTQSGSLSWTTMMLEPKTRWYCKAIKSFKKFTSC